MYMFDGHFQILDTNDNVAKLQAAYMTTTGQVDIQKTQLYAQFCLIICNNPSYEDTASGGGHSKTDK